MRQLSRAWGVMCISLCLSMCRFTYAADKQPVREWSDNTGTYSVEARLLPGQSDGLQAALKLSDGKTVILPIRRLSRHDREYVAAAVEQKAVRPPTINVCGIEWLSDLNTAGQVAAGGPSRADDRPILCFRALGDLSGFM